MADHDPQMRQAIVPVDDDGNAYSNAPARRWAAVTPSDTTTLTGVRALYVGTGGDLVIEGDDGNEETFANVADGTLLDVGATKVKAATTATDIVALF